MSRLIISVLLAATTELFGLGCGKTFCDCPPDVLGLVITTGMPVTTVALSGSACSGGRFRCIPEDFDNTIHGVCDRLQIDAREEGHCVVTLVVGGARVEIEREMTRRPAGCCGGFIGEANFAGEIDLRMPTTGK